MKLQNVAISRESRKEVKEMGQKGVKSAKRLRGKFENWDFGLRDHKFYVKNAIWYLKSNSFPVITMCYHPNINQSDHMVDVEKDFRFEISFFVP